MAQENHQWDTLLRYRLIEIIALWEGRVTSNILQDAFAIGRQKASRIINQYMDKVASDNLVYDKHLKGYKPSSNFKPVMTQGNIGEYLHLLNGHRDLHNHFTNLSMHHTNTEVILPLHRAVNPEFIRPIIQAARGVKRLEIKYASLNSEQVEYRVINPHTLVFSGYRWHVRAFCEKNMDYRDFVLSRIKEIPDPFMPSDYTIKDDLAWNAFIDLKLVPDSRLQPFQQQLISEDYAMKNNCLKIETRAALASYVLQFLKIEYKPQHENPLKQPLVLENYQEVKQWLFAS